MELRRRAIRSRRATTSCRRRRDGPRRRTGAPVDWRHPLRGPALARAARLDAASRRAPALRSRPTGLAQVRGGGARRSRDRAKSPSSATTTESVARAGEGARLGDRTERRRRGALQVRALPPDEPDEAHLERVRAALRLIAAGDLYEVNLARRIRLKIVAMGSPCSRRFSRLRPPLGDSFKSWAITWCAAPVPSWPSPCAATILRTCPVKGTRPRGTDARSDACLAAALDADPEGARRADHGGRRASQRSRAGRRPRERARPRRAARLAGRTVWSRVAEVVARRAAGVTLDAVARAVLPCGSITGAPKVRAMEVIARLEPWRRGVYTGVFGWVGRDGRLELAMAIRTLQWRRTPSRRERRRSGVLHRRWHRGRQRARAGAGGDAMEGRPPGEARGSLTSQTAYPARPFRDKERRG